MLEGNQGSQGNESENTMLEFARFIGKPIRACYTARPQSKKL